ncbi:MAG: hypothetical protein ACUVYA_17710, partial [Planctomycetota bacterium]
MQNKAPAQYEQIITISEQRQPKMESQHTFFYGRKQGQTPPKDGQNPSVPQRRFRAPTADAFQVRFSN